MEGKKLGTKPPNSTLSAKPANFFHEYVLLDTFYVCVLVKILSNHIKSSEKCLGLLKSNTKKSMKCCGQDGIFVQGHI